MPDRSTDLERIRDALREAGALLRTFTADTVGVRYKDKASPVTEADIAADALLRANRLRDDEGCLSEETLDDRSVDPLDGRMSS